MIEEEILREAARVMRERARLATDTRWSIWHDLDHQGFKTVGDEAGVLTPERPETDECNPVAHVYIDEDAEHIAGMDPAVALAVADWLDGVAETYESDMSDFCGGRGHEAPWPYSNGELEECNSWWCDSVTRALTVARTYLRLEDSGD